MSTLALNKLWEYIQVLALSNQNKQWLAQKLIESQTKDNDSFNEKEEKLYSMIGAWSDNPDMADKTKNSSVRSLEQLSQEVQQLLIATEPLKGALSEEDINGDEYRIKALLEKYGN